MLFRDVERSQKDEKAIEMRDSSNYLRLFKNIFVSVLIFVFLYIITIEWKMHLEHQQYKIFDRRKLRKLEERNRGYITEMIGRLEYLIKEEKYNKKDAILRTAQICLPQENIVFIKTHKTGSSTFTNILNRFADFRELNVVLPIIGMSRFTWPRKFHWSSVDLMRMEGQPGNLLTNHARYNRAQMDLVMADGTQYVTILRNPVTQFESSFYYFEFDRILRLKNETDPVRTFMDFPDEYLYNMSIKMNSLPDTINLIQSGMLYDLGYNFLDVQEDDAIKSAIETLEKELKLVMIMEYFDESLVLLKLEMCWQLDDILYIKQNQRSKKKAVDDDLKQRIQEWSRADVVLYQHFNRTLWNKINSYGDHFWKELAEFKQKNLELRHACSPRKVTQKAVGINVNVTEYVMGFKVDRYHRHFCKKALMSEMKYLEYFRKKFSKLYGYQKILVAEGIRPVNRTNILQRRMKKMAKLMLKNKFKEKLVLAK